MKETYETYVFKPYNPKLPIFVVDFDNGVLRRIVVNGRWSFFAIRFDDVSSPMLCVNVYTIDILCPLPNKIVDAVFDSIQSILHNNDYDVIYFAK